MIFGMMKTIVVGMWHKNKLRCPCCVIFGIKLRKHVIGMWYVELCATMVWFVVQIHKSIILSDLWLWSLNVKAWKLSCKLIRYFMHTPVLGHPLYDVNLVVHLYCVHEKREYKSLFLTWPVRWFMYVVHIYCVHDKRNHKSLFLTCLVRCFMYTSTIGMTFG